MAAVSMCPHKNIPAREWLPLEIDDPIARCSAASANISRSMKHVGENVVRIEAEALRALADRLAGRMASDFTRARELMFGCRGRVVVPGMGKSGLIAEGAEHRAIGSSISSGSHSLAGIF